MNLNLLDPDNSNVLATSITATTSGDIAVESTDGGDGSGTFTFEAVTAAEGNIDISATGGNITARDVSTAATAGKPITITVSQADMLLTHDSGTIQTNNGLIELTTGDIALTSAVNSGSALTKITDVDDDGIGLGATAVTDGLNLSGAELQQITAGDLTLQTAGSITVDGITAGQSDNIDDTVTLSAGVDVTFTNDESTFNALHAEAGDNVIVDAELTTDEAAITVDAGAAASAIQLGADVTSETSTDFNHSVLLTEDITLTAGTTLTFHNTVDGSEDLILDVTDATTFNAAVGDTARLGDGVGLAITVDSADSTVFEKTLKTKSGLSQFGDSGSITFRGDVDLLAGDTSSRFFADVTLDGMKFESARDVGFGNTSDDTLTLAGGNVEIVVTGSGNPLNVYAQVEGKSGNSANLTVATSGNTRFLAAVGSTTAIGSGTGAALTVNSTYPATTTFENKLVTASGIVQANSAGQVVFKEDVTIGAGNTDSTFNAAVQLDGMTLTSAGNLNFGDTPASDQVTISTGAVEITTASADRNITFNAKLDGPQDLTINAGNGATHFNGQVGGTGPLASLTTDAGGTTYAKGGLIATSGDQTYEDELVLEADATFAGTNVTFKSTVDDDGDGGTDSNLVVNASGTAWFEDEVGGVNPIDSITTDASGTTKIEEDVFVSGGTMTFNDDVVLMDSIQLTDTGATGITFAKTLTGNYNLSLNVTNSAAEAIFQGSVEIGNGFGPALDVNATSKGGVTFESTVTLASGITQRAGAGRITFRDDVVIEEGTTATTFDSSVTLDGLTFTSERDVTFGDGVDDDVTLAGATVVIETVGTGVSSGQPVTGGPIVFDSAIDGAVDLTINSTEAIQFNQPVGSVAHLGSLTATAVGPAPLTITQNITADGNISLTVEGKRLVDLGRRQPVGRRCDRTVDGWRHPCTCRRRREPDGHRLAKCGRLGDRQRRLR